jgi:Zn-dependent protease with chaperone function
MRALQSHFALTLALAVGWSTAEATIIVNPPMTTDRELVVQLIQAREDNGTTPATVFGNAAQRLSIENALDQIWAQAGINITVISTVTPYNSSFALDRNNMTSGTRPQGDFDTIFLQASAAGVLNTGNVINAIFVDYVPGFGLLAENAAAGLASLPGNEITVFVGDTLLTFQNGLDVIASVFAHEIGHNLGLDHQPTGSDNLMAVSGATSERLNAAQISTARTSSLLRVIPEPSTALLIAVSLALLAARRRQFTP